MNGPFPQNITMVEKYDPAMKMTGQAEADAYFERLVQHQMDVNGHARAEAERLERRNLAYRAGVLSKEDRARVEALFRCAGITK